MNRAKNAKPTLPGSRVKLTFRKHILPPLMGFLVFVSVLGFLNSQLIAGQLEYYLHSHDKHQVSVLDAATVAYTIDPNTPPRIIINKIGVSAPVNFDETKVNEGVFLQDLQHGTVHYPGTALPGEAGNVVIFGHSSGVWWEQGDYKFVFTLLNKLAVNDNIFVEYKGVRYTYRVDHTTVVMPTDMSVLAQGNTHTLTLITCTPVGTSAKRLIIVAKQIVPKVVDTPTHTSTTLPKTVKPHNTLPSASPSFWHNF